MRSFRIIVVLGALVFTAGCHSSKSAAPTQATTSVATANPASHTISDPCKLLSQSEASAALGEKLDAGKLKHFGPDTRCQFFAGENEDLFLDVADPSMFEALAHGSDAKPVSGIGDKALWQHNEYATFLHILKGGNLVSMGLPRTMSNMTPGVENAGKLIASRM